MAHSGLCAALQDLRDNPTSSIASPPNVPKRASVSLVLRVQPHPSHPPPKESGTLVESIEDFFQQPWVQHGEPEALFIKRAARKGDRWTSHVAFPGGKRDPEDGSDLAAAVRETVEEVGLDLDLGTGTTLLCGKLPDRVIATNWGTIPLMVLCPFVFLHVSPHLPGLRLQPAEVASAHWIPLRILLSPRFRTVETCDVSDRLARRSWPPLVRYLLRFSLGYMESSAVRLWPSHSVYSTFGNDFLSPVSTGKWETPLLLWGLSLGVVEDFLDMLPPLGHAIDILDWPTFTAPDVRFVVWMMTKGLRGRNLETAKRGSMAMAMVRRRAEARGGEGHNMDESTILIGIDGSQTTTTTTTGASDEEAIDERVSSVNVLLDGYHETVRKAVWITLAARTAVCLAIAGTVSYKLLRR